MNNRQWQILEAIRMLLQKDISIKYVGYYPDDIELIGKALPAVIIIDGDENNYRCLPAFSAVFEYNVSLLLVIDKVQGLRISDALAFQIKVQNIISKADHVFSECGANWIKFVSVTKGDASPISDVSAVGYLPGLTVRRIDMMFEIEDTLQ